VKCLEVTIQVTAFRNTRMEEEI